LGLGTEKTLGVKTGELFQIADVQVKGEKGKILLKGLGVPRLRRGEKNEEERVEFLKVPTGGGRLRLQNWVDSSKEKKNRCTVNLVKGRGGVLKQDTRTKTKWVENDETQTGAKSSW